VAPVAGLELVEGAAGPMLEPGCDRIAPVMSDEVEPDEVVAPEAVDGVDMSGAAGSGVVALELPGAA
jgi:hypothetical protein